MTGGQGESEAADLFAPVWVLEDPRAGTASQALGIAERLGVPFRRIRLDWNWMAPVVAMSGATLGRRGSLLGMAAPLSWPGKGPRLVISAGTNAASVALWLRGRFRCRIVHCMRPQAPMRSWVSLLHQFDMLVVPEHDRPPQAANVFPVCGAPHRVAPLVLARAKADWAERLGHLPRPLVALMVGGALERWYRQSALSPALAHNLGRQVARLAAESGGAVLASTSRRTGAEAEDALAAGLRPALHLLHRWNEPGENPYLGFLASADAVVVTGDSVSMLSEACATAAPVFAALPNLGGPRQQRFLTALGRSGQIRLLQDSLSPWPRRPLDEAGRIAAEIQRRFGPLASTEESR